MSQKSNVLDLIVTKFKVSASSLIEKTTSLVEPVKHKAPIVYYSMKAYHKINRIVKACDLEVGWFGTVDKIGDNYLITDIFVPKQKVTSYECDIDAEDLADLALLVDDPEKLIYWGHSHVNMAVRPSGQDEEQVSEYLDHTDVFIRGIHNKKGEVKMDIFDTVNLICHECVKNILQLPPLNDEEIDALNRDIKENVNTRVIYQGHGGGTKGRGNQGKQQSSKAPKHKGKDRRKDKRDKNPFIRNRGKK